MPISQADLDSEPPTSSHSGRTKAPAVIMSPDPLSAASLFATESRILKRCSSEEDLPTELCDGPVLDVEEQPFSHASTNPEEAFRKVDNSPERNPSVFTSDRTELIERLKRGERTTWVPNRNLESVLNQLRQPSPSLRNSRPPPVDPPTLLPAADISPKTVLAPSPATVPATGEESRLRDGLGNEKPGSALHTGNFAPSASDGRRASDVDRAAENGPESTGNGSQTATPLAAVTPKQEWMAASSPMGIHAPLHINKAETAPVPMAFRSGGDYGSSSLASSISPNLASSLIYRAAPTSPLAQSEINEDLVPVSAELLSNENRLGCRRHTVNMVAPTFTIPPPASPGCLGFLSHRRDGSVPYRAHQPHRSASGIPIQNHSPPQTPHTPVSISRSRRPSQGAEFLLHAPMLGSYEESILRGRMSSTPSKPFEFLAQIGVLGIGRCPASLRCPAHVTLPFLAVFYNYSSTPNDGPSPYVGQIDLENGLPNQEEELRTRRKAQSRNAAEKKAAAAAAAATAAEAAEAATADGGVGVDCVMTGVAGGTADASDTDKRKIPRPKRRIGSPKAPPGGSYRIPEQGQVQVVIKNPNKTAVKLFLVPYDLTGMEPGTKTFIRQRSYSTGPVIERVVPPVSASPSSAVSSPATASERPIIRYLVHMHICSPSRGRYYLYRSIRVVFANRVPDGEERLRNEITSPDPQFSPYKPTRVNHHLLCGEVNGLPASASSPSSHGSAAVKGAGASSFGRFADASAPEGLSPSRPQLAFGSPADPISVQPISSRDRVGSGLSDSTVTAPAGEETDAAMQSPGAGKDDGSPSLSTGNSALRIGTYRRLGPDQLGKTNKSPTGHAEGLLSQGLRSLGVQRQQVDEKVMPMSISQDTELA